MKRRWIILSLGATLAVAIAASTVYGRWMMKDAAGLTLATVEEQSLETQYHRLGEHFEVLWEETEQLQRLVHEGEWDSVDVGRVMPGTYGPRFVLKARATRSYFIQTQKGFDLPEGASRVELMTLGLERLGYSYTQSGSDAAGTVSEVQVKLPSGGIAIYREHVNGRGLLGVYTGLFWGDGRTLQAERANRPYGRPPEPSFPGQNPDFPAWDVPKR